MIRTDTDYRRALQRLADEAETLRAQREHLSDLGLTDEEVERAMEPLLSFRAQLEEEVEAYTRMKRGDLGPLQSLTAIGRWLVGARIARGLTQQELADRLGVDPSQVSRDERNDYRGVTTERAQRILEALGVRFIAQAESLLTSTDDATEYV
jgi:ribosome-binding protein aMBF1 (putative translation factor)